MHLAPELKAKLDRLATERGRPLGELIEDAVAGYVNELGQAREILDARYDDLKSGKEEPVDGEAFFEHLRQREEDALR